MAGETEADHRNECYCMSLRNAANALTSLYDEALAPTGLTVRQFSLLCTLSRIGCRTSAELARASHLERSTLTRMLKPLVAKGLIADEKEEGARNSRLGVTDEGMKLIAEGVPLWREAQQRVEALVDEDDLAALVRIAALICDEAPHLHVGSSDGVSSR